jgi:hypothetical protein
MRNLKGRVALFDDDAKALFEVASLGKTYVEIGTLFGASACIAGLAGCEVFCIDPLDGYYSDMHGVSNRPDKETGLVPSPEIVRGNWEACGLDQEKLHIFPQLHPPWPKEIDRSFDIGLIDGDHRLQGIYYDYIGMGPRVEYLMFHDCNKPQVMAIVNTAMRSETWERYNPKSKHNTTMAVLKRKHK